jgi:hypothetical protein
MLDKVVGHHHSSQKEIKSVQWVRDQPLGCKQAICKHVCDPELLESTIF